MRAAATEGADDTMSTRSGRDPVDSGRNGPDPGLNAVMRERRRLINLAYRLLGSLAEAEDAVQETYARWYTLSKSSRKPSNLRAPG